MKLDRPLLRLPLAFDAAALAAEVAALPDEAWRPHPNKFPGNEGVPLVSPRGEVTDSVAGPMAPTGALRACPYIMDVMARIGAVWGRSRLMRLAPGAMVPPHIDTNYYWRTHLRLHIPVTTNPDVTFTCGGESVHMAAGECWVFDTWQPHRVVNKGSETRVHLVLDTVGGEDLWTLIERARAGDGPASAIAPDAGDPDRLRFEQFNAPGIMSPWELRSHIAFITAEAERTPELGPVLKRLDRLAAGWTAAWAQYGASGDGLGEYQGLLAAAQGDLEDIGIGSLKLRNQISLQRQLAQLVFDVAARPQPPAA